jgi:S-adenosylmethionine-diacylgycerolhomoserine-N-methlytransferase
MNPAVALALLRGFPEGGNHQQRLERFYGPQVEAYDRTRERLLPGRADVMGALALRLPDQATVVDLGGGTGSHLEHLGEAHQRLARLHLVDLCGPLLEQARQRGERQGWRHLRTHHADATTWRPSAPVDAVICSFSLTMIPAWWRAVDHAVTMLRPGGFLAVVDFTVSGAHPEAGLAVRPAWMRMLWPTWFAHDGVRLSPDHLPYLRGRLQQDWLVEGLHRLPWMPLRVPWYGWIGRTGTSSTLH